MTDDLPIALRRPRRGATQKRPTETRSLPSPETPRRDKKRVRFSEPGPTGEVIPDDDCSSPSTGLTPFMRRARLSVSADGRKRRRHSGPADLAITHALLLNSDAGCAEQVTFLPLRQVLDGRVKKRLRRNGLSEEMNHVSADKKRKSLKIESEIDELRAAVALRDAELRRFSDATIVSGDANQDIHSLRNQVELLRHVLQEVLPPSLDYDSGLNGDAEEDGWEAESDNDYCVKMDKDAGSGSCHNSIESTMDEPTCSTPSQRRAHFRNSIPTPPSTSPVMQLMSPPTRRLFTPTSHAREQLPVVEDETSQLEDDAASLYLEIEKLTSALEGYEAMASRLSEKLAPFAPENGSAADAILESRAPSVKVEVQLNRLIRTFKERIGTLSTVTDRLSNLGLRGNDAPGMIASLAAAFRTARLELEYLDPGESTLPLTASGAAVLDLLLTRLRVLAREKSENEERHNTAAFSLQRQLTAHMDTMTDMKEEINTLKGKVKLRNVRIQELETGMDKLRMSVKTYTRDIAELERLAQKLECDLAAANDELQQFNQGQDSEQEEQTEALETKNATISDLEKRLECAAEQVAALRARHKEEVDAMKQQHSSSLAQKDDRIAELGLAIEEVNQAFQRAQVSTPTVVEKRVTRRSARC